EPPPEFFSQDLPFPEDLSTAEAPASATSEAELPEADDAEARNRPFYELVRSSMVEAAAHGTSEEAFERWLRQFHNERDDEWFANNRTRVYN
ncbi:ppk5, partial [Symbiodinium microadriaticum]